MIMKKKILITIPLLLLPKIVKGGGIDGHIYETWKGLSSDSAVVRIWVNSNSNDTLYDTIPSWDEVGLWDQDDWNFNTTPSIGDTLKIKAIMKKNSLEYKTHLRKIKEGTETTFPTTFLDDPEKPVKAHGFGVWTVKDTSKVSDTLRAEAWLLKNLGYKFTFWNYFLEQWALDDSTEVVDTSDIYPQVYFNLEKQDSLWVPSDSVKVKLYKIKGDTTWAADTIFALDTLRYGCATYLDTLIFPERKVVKKPFIDFALTEILSPPDSVKADSTYVPKVKVRNQSEKSDSVKVNCIIDSAGSTIYNDTAKAFISLDSKEDTATLQFKPWTARSSDYFIKFKNITGLAKGKAGADSVTVNDSLVKQLYLQGGATGKKEKGLRNLEVRLSNPSGFLKIEGLDERARIEIYDITGRYVTGLEAKNGRCEWNFYKNGRELPDGIYFIKIESKKGTKVEKFIKIKN